MNLTDLTNEQIYEFELAKLRAQQARDEEHYQSAMAMSEKHRKNWVEASQECNRLAEQLKSRARPLGEWHEDDGDVLWWKFPIEEAPYVGTPLDLGQTVAVVTYVNGKQKSETQTDVGGWPGYHTHWTPLPPKPIEP